MGFSAFVRRVLQWDGCAVGVLALGAFTGVLNGALLSPLLTPIATDFGMSEGATGQLNTISALAAMFFALLAAPRFSHFPRRTWLRVQIPFVALAAIIAAVSPNFACLAGARVLAGIGGSLMLATCMSFAGDLFPDPVKRNRAIGIIVSATTLAIVVGLSMIAQIEAAANWRLSIAALLVPLAILLAGTAALPGGSRSGIEGTTPPIAGYGQLIRDPRSLWLIGTMVIYMLVYAGWLTYFAAYLRADFAAGAGTLSALFLFSGGAEIAANNLSPFLLRRCNPATVYLVTAVLWSANLLVTGLLYTTVWSLFCFMAVTGIAACVLYMAIYIKAVEAPEAVRGTLVSLVSAGSGLGAALGALAGGVALAAFGGYVPVYRLLGLILLGSAATFSFASREHHPATLQAPNAHAKRIAPATGGAG